MFVLDSGLEYLSLNPSANPSVLTSGVPYLNWSEANGDVVALNFWPLPGVVKSGGLLPLPSVLVPQLVKTSKLPVDFE